MEKNDNNIINVKMMRKLLGVLPLLLTAVLAAPNARIIGGNDAQRGAYPYQISLQFCTTICQHVCGGAILSRNWIVTAGHCITDITAEGAYSVLAGVLNLNEETYQRQLIRTTHGILHPDYVGGANPHDLALFRLSSPLQYNSQVRPINLPSPGDEILGVSTLTGWGAIGSALDVPIMPSTLQAIDVPVITAEDCKVILDAVISDGQHPLDLDANICSGPINGDVSACIGDSGSPLVQNDVLVGIVSWSTDPCAYVGAPSSVYTKISHYVHWIRAEVDDDI